MQRRTHVDLFDGNIRYREINIHWLAAIGPRAADCRVHLVAEGELSKLDQEILAVADRQFARHVFRDRPDCSDAAHATREQGGHQPGGCTRRLVRKQLFLATRERDQLRFAMQDAARVPIAAR